MKENSKDNYQVLARKYRPATFSDLIGQDTMVRTLTNAFEANRIAQAFILTGIRGTGKTSTARIIAKGVNCIGEDGNGSSTTEPCGKCEHCESISNGRHVDVFEMDAASKTGVADIREIIESVQYRATSARFKIYIIDEVHMLSNSAFNALLKTLEEPPKHIIFIFATTEIQKIPVTVLSRCQRFDLRRIEPEIMIEYLKNVAAEEGVEISKDALALITRASEGSVRDSISLLDQSISNAMDKIDAKDIRDMLGLSDRGRILDLFNLIVSGDTVGALNELSSLYSDGGEPEAILNDLAEISHWISLIKITPEAAEDPTVSPDERSRGKTIANRLNIRSLSRMWQMLLVALDEIRIAPNSMMAAEMTIIRLTHVSELPSPEELIKKIQNGSIQGNKTNIPIQDSTTNNKIQGSISDNVSKAISHPVVYKSVSHSTQNLAEDRNFNPEHIYSFRDVIELIKLNRDIQLLVEVETCLRLTSFSSGRIEFVPTNDAPANLAQKLGTKLTQWSGIRWAVSVVNEGGESTIAEMKLEESNKLNALAKEHKMVQTAFLVFPNAKITNIRSTESMAQEAAIEALPEVTEEWDPFEDD
ncbi:MAG: DNA polymerase III subunit gamma/tau [Rhodobacteraceae bacterium]|nr:DNA polymerase III subunit gamma/tau [Paracoccaceae bacterium]